MRACSSLLCDIGVLLVLDFCSRNTYLTFMWGQMFLWTKEGTCIYNCRNRVLFKRSLVPKKLVIYTVVVVHFVPLLIRHWTSWRDCKWRTYSCFKIVISHLFRTKMEFGCLQFCRLHGQSLQPSNSEREHTEWVITTTTLVLKNSFARGILIHFRLLYASDTC